MKFIAFQNLEIQFHLNHCHPRLTHSFHQIFFLLSKTQLEESFNLLLFRFNLLQLVFLHLSQHFFSSFFSFAYFHFVSFLLLIG